MIDGHPEIYMFAIYSGLIWALWLLKMFLSARYRPFTGEFTGTTSVIVPVLDEPEDLFRDVLARMVEQKPGEIIVVINGARNATLERITEEFAPLARWVHTPIPGKRNAVMIGTELSTGDITVLVDSDTVWTPGTLAELVKPFANDNVGGVTTRQRILEPERSWITRWADWLENSRALYSMPAQSVLGQIGCLPGRTIAFRRSIMVRVMDKFMNERFMGVFLEVSDDRTLTNLTLKEGYRTVYQHTSLVYTDAPLQIKKLFKQQLRWARGSQYNTLRMLPWMLGHAPVLAVFFIMDILLPFLLAGVIAGWVYRAVTGQGYNFYEGILTEYGLQGGVLIVLALMLVSSVLSMAIRQIRHLSEKPTDFFRLPIFIIVSTAFLMPIRLLGFFRMGHASGWGTRAGAYAGGAANDEIVSGLGTAPRVDETEYSLDWDVALSGTRATDAAPHAIAPSPVSAVTATAVAGTATATAVAPHVGELLDVSPRRAAAGRLAAPAPQPVRRLNPKAAWPYIIGFTIFATEAFFIVNF